MRLRRASPKKANRFGSLSHADLNVKQEALKYTRIYMATALQGETIWPYLVGYLFAHPHRQELVVLNVGFRRW